MKKGLTFFVCAIFSSSLLADVPIQNPSSYKIGDLVLEDIAAPHSVTVLDSDATGSLREKEARSFPAFFRFNPRALDEADADFQLAFKTARASFQKDVEANFLLESLFQDRKLDTNALASDRFTRVINSFRNQNESFPLTKNLAELWATGGSDDALRGALAGRLRTVMQRHILRQSVPDEESIPGNAVLISVTNLSEAIPLTNIPQQSKKILTSEFYTLAKAKSELQWIFPVEEQPVAKFLTSFIRENCAYDAELTRQYAAQTTNKIWLAAHYEPGEIIAKRGDLITAATIAALDQLKSIKPSPPTQRVFGNKDSLGKIIGSISLVVCLCVATVWIFRRVLKSKREKSFATINNWKSIPPIKHINLQGLAGDDGAPQAMSSPGDVQFWRERALDAEQRLEKMSVATKAHLIPHFARLMMGKFVRRLVSQQTAMLDAQEMATLKVLELEKCLEKIQAPPEKQLEAYQLRIEQLEKELAVKNEENRELLRATIQLTQSHLKVPEPATRQTRWN